MDPSKCLQILHVRNHSCDPEKEEYYRTLYPTGNDVTDTNSPSCLSLDILTAMDNISLMNHLTTLQGDRVQAYMEFNANLKFLAEKRRLGEYPNLCAEMTSRFSVLSQKMNRMKEIFHGRNLHDIAQLVSQIQCEEKDKLLLVAAQHLDIIQQSGISLALNMGNLSLMATQDNMKYSAVKIAEIEEKISVLLESFQSMKCDYLEG